MPQAFRKLFRLTKFRILTSSWAWQYHFCCKDIQVQMPIFLIRAGVLIIVNTVFLVLNPLCCSFTLLSLFPMSQWLPSCYIVHTGILLTLPGCDMHVTSNCYGLYCIKLHNILHEYYYFIFIQLLLGECDHLFILINIRQLQLRPLCLKIQLCCKCLLHTVILLSLIIIMHCCWPG